MQKSLLLIPFLLIATIGCSPSKPVEVEMLLPIPVSSPTVAVTASPTVVALVPTATAEIPQPQYLIEDIKGTVLIVPSDSGIPETAAEGESVEPGDEILTKDASETTLALNTNTLVHLSENSHIKVTDLSANKTNGFNSKIQLLLGNILSEVEKLNESHSAFEVEAGGVVCSVRGTAFEVEKQGVNISTSTYHGKVQMQKNGNIQTVADNEHSTFSLKRSGFLPQRRLTVAEKKHYQVWVKKKAVVQQKRENRINGHAPTHTKPAAKTVSKTNGLKKDKPTHKGKPLAKPNQHKPVKKQSSIRSSAKVKKPIPKAKPTPVAKPAHTKAGVKPLARPQKQRKPDPKKKPKKKDAH